MLAALSKGQFKSRANSLLRKALKFIHSFKFNGPNIRIKKIIKRIIKKMQLTSVSSVFFFKKQPDTPKYNFRGNL